MSHLIRFVCPACGKRMVAAPDYLGRRTLCHGCGRKPRVREARGTIHRAIPYARPAPRADRVAALAIRREPGAEEGTRPDRRTLWICATMALVGLALIAVMAWSGQDSLRGEEEARANA